MLNFNLAREAEVESADRSVLQPQPRPDERPPAENAAGGDEEKRGE